MAAEIEEHRITSVHKDEESEGRKKQVKRGQWLRAAILGANDGLLSTTSIMLGVGAAKEDRWSMVVSGVAGAIAGACSMAVGEFVSVSTQRDIEKVCGKSTSGRDVQTIELLRPSTLFNSNSGNTKMPEAKPPPTAVAAAPPVMNIGATALERREQAAAKEGEGASEILPSPIKAAAPSFLAFLMGSLVPLLACMFVTRYTARIVVLVGGTSTALAVFGGLGAHLGGSPVLVSATRVLVGGWIAMGITYGLLKSVVDKDNFV